MMPWIDLYQNAWGAMFFLVQYEYEWEILDYHDDFNESMKKK